MSEQAPQSEDTPTLASPEEGTPGAQQAAEQAEIDYQQRYDDLRPEFDRKSQRVSELEQRERWFELLSTSEDPDTRRQAAQALGYEVADEAADEGEYADPSDALAREVAAIKEQLANQAQEAQQAQQIAKIEQHVEQQLAGLDGLNERQRKYIVNTAVAMPPTADGMPNIKGAYEQWIADMNEEKKDWAKTKRTHAISPVGAAGTQQPDLSTTEGKTAHILGRMAAEEQ